MARSDDDTLLLLGLAGVGVLLLLQSIKSKCPALLGGQGTLLDCVCPGYDSWWNCLFKIGPPTGGPGGLSPLGPGPNEAGAGTGPGPGGSSAGTGTGPGPYTISCDDPNADPVFCAILQQQQGQQQ